MNPFYFKGEEYSEYFGIICRETTITGMDMYVGYIFQCQSAKIVSYIYKTCYLIKLQT